MDFKQATDRATSTCIALADIADAAGVKHHSVRRARLDPRTASYRSPPAGWEQAIAKLARERARELLGLAEELELGGLEGLEG